MTDSTDASQSQTVAAAPVQAAPTGSSFDGDVWGYLGWTIFLSVITSLTFGFGAPIGMCKLYEWEINHTTINGRRLRFTGTAGDLFVPYLKWLILTIITFGIYGLWAALNIQKWKTEHTVFAE